MQDPISLVEWNEIASYISIGLGAVAILIVLGYSMMLSSMRDAKKKYDYINKNEINTLWVASIIILAAISVIVNTISDELTPIMIGVRAFVTVMMALIVGVIVQNLLKFYYPFYIEKRLKKLRYKPRISPKTGKPMKLLSEEEEDVYLDEGMQAEEDVFSIDYDVWIDEETGYTKIEKYSGHLHADQCPECNYQTLRVVKEDLLEEPTHSTEGELEKYYNCGYCGYKTRKTFRVAKLSESTTEEAPA